MGGASKDGGGEVGVMQLFRCFWAVRASAHAARFWCDCHHSWAASILILSPFRWRQTSHTREAHFCFLNGSVSRFWGERDNLCPACGSGGGGDCGEDVRGRCRPHSMVV